MFRKTSIKKFDVEEKVHFTAKIAHAAWKKDVVKIFAFIVLYINS